MERTYQHQSHAEDVKKAKIFPKKYSELSQSNEKFLCSWIVISRLEKVLIGIGWQILNVAKAVDS